MAITIKWSPKAAKQLETLVEYIAEDSPRYAAIFARRIMQTVRAIPANPKLGRMVPEYGTPNLREKILQGYRIVYRLTPHAVEIAAVCHGSRPIQNAIEDPDERTRPLTLGHCPMSRHDSVLPMSCAKAPFPRCVKSVGVTPSVHFVIMQDLTP